MSDFEDRVRRTFSAHEPNAPSADGLLANVQTAASRRRAKGRWLVPLAASALTAGLVVAVVTDGFGLVGSETASHPVPNATSSTPTPNPSESAIAAKCEVRPFIGAPGAGMVDFDPNVDQKITVAAGQRILLGAVDEALCQRFVTFNGRPRSALLKPVNGIGTGSDRLRAVGEGTVDVSALQPMCAAVADPKCFGGVAQLGSITVTIKPRPTPEPVTRQCDSGQISLKAESEPGTSAQLIWVTVRLRGTAACRLTWPATIEVFDEDGATVVMPNNPLSKQIREPLRQGSPVVITWDWREPFCGRADPYSAKLGVLRSTARFEDAHSPSCPTDYGDPRADPLGLRFHSVMVLR